MSFDYMFTSATVGHQPERDMLKHLVGIDSWAKAILCLPISGEGGVSLKRWVAGVTAILKGDGEPAMKQRPKWSNYTPAGHHQSNPAERQ